MRTLRRFGLVAGLALVLSSCTWPMFRYGPERTGYNPIESTVDAANVGSLETSWKGTLGTYQDVWSSPAVYGGRAFVGHTDGVFYAFDADGTDNCAGDPTFCDPLWTAPIGVSTSPAVLHTTLYVGAGSTLYALSATGARNCTGTPLVCEPLWTAYLGGDVDSPAVVGDRLYVASSDGMLSVFDAKGKQSCSGTPKTCQPLWTAATQGYGARGPAVADGTVFVTEPYSMTLYAFDAAGVTGCAGAPKTCEPLWTMSLGFCPIGVCGMSIPVVSDGTVFVGTNESDEFPRSGRLLAIDAAGTTNCSGTPKTCEPLWSTWTRAQLGNPAVADGVVYVTDYFFDDETFESGGRLLAYDATGTGCGDPTSCDPLWESEDIDRVQSSPAIANGVAYTANTGSLFAFDATGTSGCSGTPTTCAPLLVHGLAGYVSSSPAVANGSVYIGERGALAVLGLP